MEYLLPAPSSASGVESLAPAVKKTTIDLEIDLFKRLKQYSLDTDKSVRVIVSEAISEKLSREASRDGSAPSTTRLIKRNPIADGILTELLTFFPEELAVRLLSQKCAEQGLMPEALRPSDVSAVFVESLARPVQLMSPGPRVVEFSRKVELLARGAR
jgi:hypothetical protein